MTKRLTKRLVAVLSLSLVLYVTAYFLLMRTDYTALNDDGFEVYRSGYVFAKCQRYHGCTLTIEGPHESWANRLFLPVDECWRAIKGLPDGRIVGTTNCQPTAAASPAVGR